MNIIENNSSPDLLLKLISEEINRLDNQSIRSGTNPWILLAAFAAILWMIFPEIYSYGQSYYDLAVPFITLHVILDLSYSLISTLNFNNLKKSENHDRFQFADTYIGCNRNTILLELIKVGVVIIIISYISKQYNYIYLNILYIPYAIKALILPLMFVLSFFKFPLNTLSGKKDRIFLILLNITTIFCFLTGLFFFYKITILYPPSITSWQISGSLLVLSIILSLLAKSNIEYSPLHSSLIDLRRDLVLNKISFESAITHADIIFFGLSISHILQNDVEKLLELQRNISHILHSITNEYEAIKNAALNTSSDKCTLCSSLKRSVDSYMTELQQLTKDYIKQYKKFKFRYTMLLKMSKSSESEIEFNKIQEIISQNINKIEESLILVQEKRSTFKSDLNCEKEIKQIAECQNN